MLNPIEVSAMNNFDTRQKPDAGWESLVDDAEWEALLDSEFARATLAEAVLVAPPPELDQRILAMAKAAIEAAEDGEWEMLLASDTARAVLAEAVLIAPPPELDQRILAMAKAKAAMETELVVEVPASPPRRSEGRVIYVNFRPLITIERLAADGGEVAPLPDPDRPLESVDGRFRLWIRPADDEIEIILEALGFASDVFAHRRLGLASAEACPTQDSDQALPLHADVVIAQFVLDGDGEAACRIPNSLAMRQALLRPVIGLIDEDD
jgi:hypothetical protein